MLHAIIMAGGSGTRLWPESRKNFPKQFLSLDGDRSFLQKTVDRLTGQVPAENIYVVCGEHLAEVVRDQLPELGAEAVLIEPFARNTAACIAYAAIFCLLKDPDAMMVVVPADHVISPDRKFHHALRFAAELVAKYPEKLVTFGVQPTYPAESFGYIERGETFLPEDMTAGTGASRSEAERPDSIAEPVSTSGTPVQNRQVSHHHDPVVPLTTFAPVPAATENQVLSPGCAYTVKRFREKPSQETAEGYIESRKYFWNSGIFVWRASAILEYLRRFTPGVFLPMQKILDATREAPGDVTEKWRNPAAQKIIREEFSGVENISIDYAVMEPAAAEGKVLVVNAPFAWDDVGSWRAMERVFPQDAAGNTFLDDKLSGAEKAAAILIDTQASIFRCSDPRKKVIACVGVKDLGVIVTPETVLIFDKYQEESVREVTKKLKEMGMEEYL